MIVHKLTASTYQKSETRKALDLRTRIALFKMLNCGVISALYDCMHVGKEANIYFSSSNGRGYDMVIKIHKTSTFKSRTRYVYGDFRFYSSYHKSQSAKAIEIWAEKEFRNLMRIHKAGILAPHPIYLRMHIVLMEFLGENGICAPRLKDLCDSQEKLRHHYIEVVLIIHRLYHICKLVHADLSEYNILYFKSALYIIDVSQSVDLEHPHALSLLREDCANINDFFCKQGLSTLTTRELFDFVIDSSSINDNIIESVEYPISNLIINNKQLFENKIFKTSTVKSKNIRPKYFQRIKTEHRDLNDKSISCV